MENEKPSEEISVVQERLNWQVVWRDDGKVAQALYAGEPIEEMHHLSDAGLLDEFFVFLKELGMLEAFGQVNQSGVKRREEEVCHLQEITDPHPRHLCRMIAEKGLLVSSESLSILT
jgi:hypothetical protein